MKFEFIKFLTPIYKHFYIDFSRSNYWEVVFHRKTDGRLNNALYIFNVDYSSLYIIIILFTKFYMLL